MAEYAVTVGGRTHLVRVTEDGSVLRVSLEGHVAPVRLEPVAGTTCLRVSAGDVTRSALVRRSGGEVLVTLDDDQYRLRVDLAVPIARRTRASRADTAEVKAPIPGVIISVGAAKGEAVEQGRALVVIEAMKMQSELRAPLAGIVTAVHVKPGQEVMGGTVLVTLAPGTGIGIGKNRNGGTL